MQSNSSGIAATRERLGLSQQQLAEQLCISKSAIGMAETGRRNLPVATLLKLAELEIKLVASQVPVSMAMASKINTAVPSRDRLESLRAREWKIEIQIQQLENLLQTICAHYEKLRGQLLSLDVLLEAVVAEPATNGDGWIQPQRERLLKQLEKCNPTEQALLRNRIALLNAELNLNKSVRRSICPKDPFGEDSA